MSGLIKGIGKVFKKVVKVARKVALPALAIGAIVMTGGAAIGALPALSTQIASLGLSPALAGALTTAAKGATMGALTSVATGGNIVKGATTGFAVGGALGAVGGIGSTAAGTGASTAGNAGVNAGASAATSAPSLGLDSLTRAGASGIGSGVASAIPAAASAVPVAAAAVPVAAAPVAAAGVPASRGIMGFINANPTMAGMALQGIGSGIAAKSQAKESRRAEEQRLASYEGYGDSLAGTSTIDNSTNLSGRLVRDPSTGQIVLRNV